MDSDRVSRTAVADYIGSCQPVLAAPVYVIDRVEPLSITELDHVQPVAWRFVLSYQGNPCATGDVARVGGSYALSMATANEPRAREIVAAVRTASEALASRSQQDRFGLRLFEAPAFHVHALWLHASSSSLFDVAHGLTPHYAGVLIEAPEFLVIFNNSQSAKLRNQVDLDYRNEPN